ncbi:MAG: hypothetical protein ACT4PT_06315, partial [Methanobacteriota archaeon]
MRARLREYQRKMEDAPDDTRRFLRDRTDDLEELLDKMQAAGEEGWRSFRDRADETSRDIRRKLGMETEPKP